VIHLNDQKSLRINNQLSILNVLRHLGPLSRKRLQDETRLSWGTITYLTNELIDLDIVRETGMVSTHVGRPPVNLDLNTDTNHVIGIWMGNVRIDAAILDIKGQAVLHRSFPLDPTADSDAIVSLLFLAVDTILREASIRPGGLAGIGCAVPGSYNPETGLCAYAPNHPRWRAVPLLRLFADRYDKPVFIDHDMNCCVLGEYLFGAARLLSNFVCVNVEGGIGAGIMIDGRIYRGVDNSAGELGHIRVKPDGPRCNCGGIGCLESVASVGALLARARETTDVPVGVGPPDAAGDGTLDPDIDTLIRAAENGDRRISSLFDEVGQYLGAGIGTLVTLFNPETVILSGSLRRAKDLLQESLYASINRAAWPYSRIDVRFTPLDNGIVMGAAGMVLQEIFANALLFRERKDSRAAASERE
jgi:predicted NBD/HSP70 family sugar kinase